MARKVVIIGGVAGGASAAARLRRLDESAQIVMVERGPYISFANCGLPYHLSGAIASRDALVVTTAEAFEARFNVRVLTMTEAVSIDREQKIVSMRTLTTGELFEQSYDELILSPGAAPIRPPLPGLDAPGVFVLRDIPDLDRIMAYLSEQNVAHATVVGAGFIGIEVAENLVEAGITVRVIERGPQILPFLDEEFASLAAQQCRCKGIELCLNTSLSGVETVEGALEVVLADGARLATGLVLVAIGVVAESTLAKAAGLELGERGGIAVDAQMRTSDPHIFAVGDAVEVVDRVTGKRLPKFLAGPANRQGRLAAEVIVGRSSTYPGALGTSIIKVFELAAACTGLSEKAAIAGGIAHRTAWIHAKDHASYYPGAKSLTLKAIFDPETGRLLGAQAVGYEGVDKRIDVLATAVAASMSVYDLEALDLAYAPPFSSAKDPVNQLGAVAAGMLRGDHPSVRWDELAQKLDGGALLLDVRELDEVNRGSIAGARHLPLAKLREHLAEIPAYRPVIVFCQEGLRGYLATRILAQNGFDACNLLGGYRLWTMIHRPWELFETDRPKVKIHTVAALAFLAT
ncbi:MAG: FAD-dependent oxidoreductase [Bradymonadaceae bacterium]|nr:FAD-dependent oxidoreductase [Lujinxingiaceae bacterium]